MFVICTKILDVFAVWLGAKKGEYIYVCHGIASSFCLYVHVSVGLTEGRSNGWRADVDTIGIIVSCLFFLPFFYRKFLFWFCLVFDFC